MKPSIVLLSILLLGFPTEAFPQGNTHIAMKKVMPEKRFESVEAMPEQRVETAPTSSEPSQRIDNAVPTNHPVSTKYHEEAMPEKRPESPTKTPTGKAKALSKKHPPRHHHPHHRTVHHRAAHPHAVHHPAHRHH